MRITNNMMIERMKGYINDNLLRMDRLQNQLATGKSINKASDDPVGCARIMKINSDMLGNEQYTRNINDGLAWLEATEGSLDVLTNILQRAREIAVRSANGVQTASDTQKMAEEVHQIIENVVGIANSTHNGRYLFSGYQTDDPLVKSSNKNYNMVPDPLVEKMEYNIGADDIIAVNVTGEEVFGPPTNIVAPENGVPQLIQDLMDLEAFLNAGNFGAVGDYDYSTGDGTQTISAGQIVYNEPISTHATDPGQAGHYYRALGNHGSIDLSAEDYGNPARWEDVTPIGVSIGTIDAHLENVLAVRAEVGSKINRLELVQKRLENAEISLTKLLSSTQDVDMAETIMDLKNQENVYNASLAGGARIIQPTLVDFLG